MMKVKLEGGKISKQHVLIDFFVDFACDLYNVIILRRVKTYAKNQKAA